jgi:hypothetical protein
VFYWHLRRLLAGGRVWRPATQDELEQAWNAAQPWDVICPVGEIRLTRQMVFIPDKKVLVVGGRFVLDGPPYESIFIAILNDRPGVRDFA